MDLLFIVNPSSGPKMKKEMEPVIAGLLKGQDFTWEFLTTTGSGDADRIRNCLEELKPKTVVGVGGDGTLNLVAGQLIHTNIPLGIIPAGSANGLAYNLEIPSDVEKALHIILKNRTTAMDVLLLNNSHHCLHLADVGLNARVVKRFEKEGSKGIGGYAIQLLKELFTKNRSIKFQLKTPHNPKEIKAEMLVISNAKSYGTGALINPEGKIDDGKFELVLLKPYPWWYIFRLLLSAFRGNLHRMENVKVISNNEMLIAFRQPQDIQVDGEIVEGLHTLKVKLLPGALKVIH